jgi:hypothetical protein
MLPMVDMHVGKDKNGNRCLINQGQSLLRDCIAGDEIEVFSVGNMQDLIQFKWSSFSLSHHTFGFYMHCLYIIILTIYTINVYINDTQDHTIVLTLDVLLVAGILYPSFLVFNQII